MKISINGDGGHLVSWHGEGSVRLAGLDIQDTSVRGNEGGEGGTLREQLLQCQ